MTVPHSIKLMVASISFSFIAGCSSMSGGEQSGDFQGDSVTDSETSSSSGTSGATRYGVSSGTGYQNGNGYEVDENGIPLVRTIYFPYDSDRIDTKYESILQGHSHYLKSNPNVTVTLQGHTDNRGTREYNMALGERRANSVKRIMTIMEAPQRQINVVSYGEERPAVQGNSEDSYGKNRRVVFKY